MLELKERQVVTFKKGTKPLDTDEIAALKVQLNTKWDVIANKKLEKEFKFENFRRAIAFVQEIAMLAEKENHHPDIFIQYTKVKIGLSTHDIGGLSVNDFILAAKIENL
jgi:4a-hydroxytetrahydrobiopterin dehydratase